MNIRSNTTRVGVIAAITGLAAISVAIAVPSAAMATIYTKCSTSWTDVALHYVSGPGTTAPPFQTRSCLVYDSATHLNTAQAQVRSAWYTKQASVNGTATLHWCNGAGITSDADYFTYGAAVSMTAIPVADTNAYPTLLPTM